ncbi:MAG TPA: MFS transporter [Ktedonobacterales bacterium]|jgi:MFS family permease
MQTQDSLASTPALWRNRDFALFWLGQSISLLGSTMTFIVAPLLVFATTHSVWQMGLVTALNGVGSLIAGIISGLLADRIDRRRMMLVLDALLALSYASIPFFWQMFGPLPLMLFVLAPVFGFLSIAATVAGTASIPRLVYREQLVQANSLMNGSFAVAFVLGPILAASLAAAIPGALIVLIINAASYLFSVGTLLVIRLRPAFDESPAQKEGAENGFAALSAGTRYLLQQPALLWVAFFRLVGYGVLSGVFDLLVYHLRQELGYRNVSIGLIWGLGGLGAIGGSILAPLLRKRLGFGVTFLAAVAIQGASLFAIGMVTNRAFLVALGLGITFGDILVQILGSAIFQEMTPDALQGRVAAAVQTAIWVGGAVGAAASTGLAASIGSTPPVFEALGGILLLCALLGSLSPIRYKTPALRASPAAPRLE